jgi:hypothetical protein
MPNLAKESVSACIRSASRAFLSVACLLASLDCLSKSKPFSPGLATLAVTNRKPHHATSNRGMYVRTYIHPVCHAAYRSFRLTRSKFQVSRSNHLHRSIFCLLTPTSSSVLGLHSLRVPRLPRLPRCPEQSRNANPASLHIAGIWALPTSPHRIASWHTILRTG